MEKEKLEVLMQSKNLVETSYNVSAIQNRVFYHILFSAQKERNGELSCTIKLEDIKKLIPNPNQRTLENIKKMFRVFKDTSLLFDKDDGGDLIECDYNLIAGSEYNVSKQEFKVFFMERLYDHILNYSNYAPLNLEIMTRFTSFYSQRLYEALRMWSRTEQTIKHIFTIDTLRFVLGIGDKYPEYKNLKQRVLNQALKEINAHGNMEVEIREIKEGKRVVKIEFIILDHEQKTYFKNKQKQITQIIQTTDDNNDIENQVQLPETDFFSPKLRTMFIKHCYTKGYYFDESIVQILNDSIEVFKFKKEKDNITTINDYKYFVGIFNNKIEDDVNKFLSSTRVIFN